MMFSYNNFSVCDEGGLLWFSVESFAIPYGPSVVRDLYMALGAWLKAPTRYAMIFTRHAEGYGKFVVVASDDRRYLRLYRNPHNFLLPRTLHVEARLPAVDVAALCVVLSAWLVGCDLDARPKPYDEARTHVIGRLYSEGTPNEQREIIIGLQRDATLHAALAWCATVDTSKPDLRQEFMALLREK